MPDMQNSSINFLDKEDVRRDGNARTPGFFCLKSPVSINVKVLADLKQFSNSSGEDVRLSLHQKSKSPFHNMLILQRRENGYRRPHRHSEKGESWHLIEGEMGAFVFDQNGKITDSCLMRPDGVFFYHLEANQYHTVIPLSDVTIFHESKLGPFLGEGDSIFPAWAPDHSDSRVFEAYQNNLINMLVKD
jgi:cupin fold WbuC family metalloprotein